MAITYSFVDSVVYGTDDINGITSSLIGAGVAPLASADSYNVSDLNGLTEAAVEAGVQLGGCRCTVSGVGTQEVSVYVAEGSLFFESGVRLDVDSDGYTFGIDANTAGFVFANYSPSLQKADIVFAEEVDSNGENVVLAQISETGTVVDMRKFASAKVAVLGKNITQKFEFQRLDEAEYYNGMFVVAKIVGVDLTKFNYAVLVTTNIHGDVELVYFPEIGYYEGFYNLTEEKLDFVMYPSGDFRRIDANRTFFYKTASGYIYYVGIVGGELCVLCDCDEDEASEAVRAAYGCTACLM